MNGSALKIGAKIREARRHRRLTLQRVSSKSGLSIGFLSQVERDITRPSLSSLVTIARSLDLPVSAFLHSPDLPTAVSRADGRHAYPMRHGGPSVEQLSTTFPGQLLNATKLHVPARHRSNILSFEGEQVVYVLSGTVRYKLDDTIYELQAGDAFHFSTSQPYEIVNPTDDHAELLAIGTEPLSGNGAADQNGVAHPRLNGG